MRIIIAGSRTFNDYGYLCQKMDKVTKNLKNKITIISGHAKGADQLGEQWAFERMHEKEIYHTDWKTYGKSAGMLRNCEMIDSEVDCLCVFWDGKSPGTKQAIEYAKKKGLKVKVFLYNKKKESKDE